MQKTRFPAKTDYSELEVAFELEKIVRMLERAAMGNPELRNGLSAACEMTKLWSLKYAPGDEQHPFHGTTAKTLDIFKRAKAGEISMGSPMPIGETERQRRTRRTVEKRQLDQSKQQENGNEAI